MLTLPSEMFYEISINIFETTNIHNLTLSGCPNGLTSFPDFVILGSAAKV